MPISPSTFNGCQIFADGFDLWIKHVARTRALNQYATLVITVLLKLNRSNGVSLTELKRQIKLDHMWDDKTINKYINLLAYENLIRVENHSSDARQKIVFITDDFVRRWEAFNAEYEARITSNLNSDRAELRDS